MKVDYFKDSVFINSKQPQELVEENTELKNKNQLLTISLFVVVALSVIGTIYKFQQNEEKEKEN